MIHRRAQTCAGSCLLLDFGTSLVCHTYISRSSLDNSTSRGPCHDSEVTTFCGTISQHSPYALKSLLLVEQSCSTAQKSNHAEITQPRISLLTLHRSLAALCSLDSQSIPSAQHQEVTEGLQEQIETLEEKLSAMEAQVRGVMVLGLGTRREQTT